MRYGYLCLTWLIFVYTCLAKFYESFSMWLFGPSKVFISSFLLNFDPRSAFVVWETKLYYCYHFGTALVRNRLFLC